MNLEPLELPLAFNVSAVFFFALTGALAARRLGYDIVGAFALAFVSGLGGGVIRDWLLGVVGPVPALTEPGFMLALLLATLGGLFRVSAKLENFNRLVAFIDAIGLGAFAAVGTHKALKLELNWLNAVFVGVVNAVGGGLLRDLLVRAEPLMLKPGQFYALAALFGACAYAGLTLTLHLHPLPAAIYATIATVTFRILAITLNWKTRAVEEPLQSP
jgi:uncharacterized membrane protein YeiH